MEGKKKRGRKPKNKIILNENPIFDNGSQLDNLIVCLKSKSSSSISNSCVPVSATEINDIQPNDCFNELSEINGNELSGINENDLSEQYKIGQQSGTIRKCWNCYQDINSNIVSFPLKYADDIFYTYGNCCSFECSARYIFDTYDNKELWDKYTLLNLYYNKIHNTHNKRVMFAHSRLSLKEFGGDMDIDEYRKKFTIDYSVIYTPPIIPISHISHNADAIKLNDNNSELKMYRKKGLNKNNIYEKMEITT
jgi:hypothetical protein